jgi:hypothetical protein
MNKLHVILFAIIFLFTSCKNRDKKTFDVSGRVESSVLIEAGEKKLYLGENDAPRSGFPRYYEKNGGKFIIQDNIQAWTASIYDYETGKLVKTKPLDKALPKGIVYCHNEDTILSGLLLRPAYISASINDTVYSIPVDVGTKDGIVKGAPYIFGGAFKSKSKWYVPCYMMGEYPEIMHRGADRPPVIEFDFTENSYRFFGEFPEIYAENNMGSSTYWEPYCVVNHHTDELLISFTATPEIHVYSLKDFTKKTISIKSSYIDTIPLPLTAKGRDYFSQSESFYYLAQYGHYGPILYDRWKRVYYRYAGIGMNDWTLKEDIRLADKKEFVIMVFNENFELLGEKNIGNIYNFRYSFVSPDGLCILKINGDGNEDIAVYTLFKYTNP